MKQPTEKKPGPTDVFPTMKPPCTECCTLAAESLAVSAEINGGAGIGLTFCSHSRVMLQLMRLDDHRLVTSCTWGMTEKECQEEMQAAADATEGGDLKFVVRKPPVPPEDMH